MCKIPSNSAALCFTVIFRTSSGKIKVNDIKVWTYFGNQSHESVRERQKRARKVSPNPITREHFRALDQSTGSNFANQKLIFLLQNSCSDPPHSSITLAEGSSLRNNVQKTTNKICIRRTNKHNKYRKRHTNKYIPQTNSHTKKQGKRFQNNSKNKQIKSTLGHDKALQTRRKSGGCVKYFPTFHIIVFCSSVWV